MGKGRGFQVNLEFILRIIELVLLIVALACFMIEDTSDSWGYVHTHSSQLESRDALNMSASIYIIILLVMVLLQLIKKLELDKTFVGVVSAIGAILLIATGIAYCALSGRRHIWNDGNGVISGILAICGGVTLVVDALKDFEVF